MENNKNNIENIKRILGGKKIKILDYEEICENLFDYAKTKLNVKNGTIKFVSLKGEGFGYTLKDEITINTKFFKTKYLGDIIDTIFHETRHLYQKNSMTTNKDINKSVNLGLPIHNFIDSVYLIDEENIGFNPFYLYFTSQNEKDARDYAGFETYKLLRELKQNANKKMEKVLTKQIELTKQKVAKNDNLYKSRLANLKINETSAYQNFDNFVEKIFNKNLSNKEMQKYASAIFSVYANENITLKFLDYAIKNNDEEILFYVLNSPYSKIDYTNFTKSIEFLKSKNISLDTITQNLSNWNKNTILNFYNTQEKNDNLNNTQEKVKHKTILDTMSKEAKIKLYNSLDAESMEK